MRISNFFIYTLLIEIILKFFPEKNRESLIKSFKYLGWTLLLLGIIAIFIGYTTAEPQSGFSGLGNVILFLGGIICCLVGFSFITGWFSVWQSRSLYDYDYGQSWSEIIESMVNDDSSASGFVVAAELAQHHRLVHQHRCLGGSSLPR